MWALLLGVCCMLRYSQAEFQSCIYGDKAFKDSPDLLLKGCTEKWRTNMHSQTTFMGLCKTYQEIFACLFPCACKEAATQKTMREIEAEFVRVFDGRTCNLACMMSGPDWGTAELTSGGGGGGMPEWQKWMIVGFSLGGVLIIGILFFVFRLKRRIDKK